MTDFWIWVDTSLASSFPILIGIYIHHEAFLDIYLFGIIVVFGVLCFLGLVWWIVIDPCIPFSDASPYYLNESYESPRENETVYEPGATICGCLCMGVYAI